MIDLRLVPFCFAGLIERVRFPAMFRIVDEKPDTFDLQRYFPDEDAWRRFLLMGMVVEAGLPGISELSGDVSLTIDEYRLVWVILQDIVWLDGRSPEFLERYSAAFIAQLGDGEAVLYRKVLECYQKLCDYNDRFKRRLWDRVYQVGEYFEILFVEETLPTTAIADLGIAESVVTALTQVDVKTVARLVVLKAEALLRHPDITAATLMEIGTRLREKGGIPPLEWDQAA